MTPSFLTRKEGRTGRITLNRPAFQHRLDLGTIQEIARSLHSWAPDEAIELVIIDHIEGSRGFCAGQDILMLATSARTLDGQSDVYLSALYQLCSQIAHYPKPIVTFLDGVVKSSAIGLAVSGQCRVATERSTLSFPDTAFGCAPDAGATKILANLPNELGVWLALTGDRLTGGDVAASGLATHFCASKDVFNLKRALEHEGVAALDAYRAAPCSSLFERFGEIDDLFDTDCANELKYRLESSGAWGRTQATKINAKSPLSTKIALRQIRTGKYLDSIDAALRMEYRITSRLVKTRNFLEGVRAMMIDMDSCPDWRPHSLKHVTSDEVAKFFTSHDFENLQLRPNSNREVFNRVLAHA